MMTSTEHNDLIEALGQIARGRPDNGRPIAAEVARQMARDVFIKLSLAWPKVQPPRIIKRESINEVDETIMRLMIDEGGTVTWKTLHALLGEITAYSRLQALKLNGVVDHPSYGVWGITEKGRIALAIHVASKNKAANT
jgi:hypothetical protein